MRGGLCNLPKKSSSFTLSPRDQVKTQPNDNRTVFFFTKTSFSSHGACLSLAHTKWNCIFHKALDEKWNHRTRVRDRPSNSSRARLSTRTSTWRLTELSWSVFFLFLEEKRFWRTNRRERRCARYCDWTSCRKSFFSLRRVDRTCVWETTVDLRRRWRCLDKEVTKWFFLYFVKIRSETACLMEPAQSSICACLPQFG